MARTNVHRAVGSSINLIPYVGKKVSMEFTFRETSTGVYRIETNFNKRAVVQSKTIYDFPMYDDVYVSYGSSPSIRFLVSEIEYGELIS